MGSSARALPLPPPSCVTCRARPSARCPRGHRGGPACPRAASTATEGEVSREWNVAQRLQKHWCHIQHWELDVFCKEINLTQDEALGCV